MIFVIFIILNEKARKLWKSQKSWKSSPNTVYIFLWTRHRLLQIIFWDSRDIIQIVKKNRGGKYFFIVEKKKFKIFKISKISKISNFFEKTQHFDILKNLEFWDFWKFRKFLRFSKIKKFRIFLIDFFSTKTFSGFFFDDLFRSQISPRFQKSHLENRVMSSKMWKSDFLRFWYTYTWPQGSDLAKIRLFYLWISKYSGKSQQKNLRKKFRKLFSIEKIFFSDVYYRQIFDMSSLWT